MLAALAMAAVVVVVAVTTDYISDYPTYGTVSRRSERSIEVFLISDLSKLQAPDADLQ